MGFKNRKLIVLILCAALALSLLSGCGSAYTAKDLVQDTLDLYYLNKTSDAFMEQMGIDETEAHSRFERWLSLEIPFFCQMFEIELDSCDPGIREQIADLYREIYSHSKFSVGEMTENNGDYSVSVTIWPIDILQRTYNEDLDGFVTDLSNRIDAGEYAGISDEEFENIWAQGMIDLVRANLSQIGYLDPQTITVRVEKDSDGAYSVNEDDFQKADELIIAY